MDKKNRVITEQKRESRRTGKAEFLLRLLDRRGLTIDDEAALQRLFDRALTVTRADELSDEP